VLANAEQTTTTRTDIDAQLQLGHHLLSIPPHFANVMHSNSGASSLFTTILQTMLFTPVLFCFCSINPHCPVSTRLCQRIDRLLLTHTVRDVTMKLLQTLSATLGANFFTASPTVRKILSSPIMSVNLAERSFWITAGPGLARTSCK